MWEYECSWHASSVFLFEQRRSTIQMAACSPTPYPTRSACPPTRSVYHLTRWTRVWPTPCHPASMLITTCWPAASVRWPSRWVTSSSSLSTKRSSANCRCWPMAAMTRWPTGEEAEGVRLCRAYTTTRSVGSWGRWWSRWRLASRWHRRRRTWEDVRGERGSPPKEFAPSRKTQRQVGTALFLYFRRVSQTYSNN